LFGHIGAEVELDSLSDVVSAEKGKVDGSVCEGSIVPSAADLGEGVFSTCFLFEVVECGGAVGCVEGFAIGFVEVAKLNFAGFLGFEVVGKSGVLASGDDGGGFIDAVFGNVEIVEAVVGEVDAVMV